ncbi:hypothetical protein GCM10009067_32050 [Haloarcula sebkhae]|uniref:Uncharacterized protein n=1 Tax=Haloarcula sebkhae TaxID=932660 RepID=A0A830F5H6_9EURY|nr:hypothetical protein GCM10009067_32050 [Haloarcula sebkhae]
MIGDANGDGNSATQSDEYNTTLPVRLEGEWWAAMGTLRSAHHFAMSEARLGSGPEKPSQTTSSQGSSKRGPEPTRM